MSEFPDDIREAAEAVARTMGLTPRRAHIDPLARAIAAERERCAKIADGKADRALAFAKPLGSPVPSDLQLFAEGCRQIAAAIRGTNA